MNTQLPDDATSAEQNSAATTDRWWLAIDGRPDGPRSTTYIAAALQSGRLTPLSPICPEGGHEWRPLGTWPAFSSAATQTADRSQAPAPPPPLAQTFAASQAFAAQGGSGFDRLLMNPVLPPMANLICIYCILVVPLYWMLAFVTDFLDDNPFLDGSGYYWAYGVNLAAHRLITLALTVLLVVSGIQFRDLQAAGERLLRLVLSAWLTWAALQWIVYLMLFFTAGVADAYDPATTEMTAWDVIGGFLNTAAFACDVVCLVWLILKRNQLPLYAR
ncbi:MAG: DUF4339 domain-containing protein [Planctomycetales bacterium]|nr:DUF4339 domain-containing protein [Planctomycetales bacterium]